jgi:hypothetical protein
MKINIEIDVTELLDKSKELDLAKVLQIWQDINSGKEVGLFNGMVKIKKIDDKQGKKK